MSVDKSIKKQITDTDQCSGPGICQHIPDIILTHPVSSSRLLCAGSDSRGSLNRQAFCDVYRKPAEHHGITSLPQSVIMWFRRDLRLNDHPALCAAAQSGPVIGVYILDEVNLRPLGGAQRWWLHHSLTALAGALEKLGVPLVLRRGDAALVLRELIETSGAFQVHATALYEPQARNQEDGVRTSLGQRAELVLHHADTLFHPDAIRTKSGTPYKVFTPYWRACRQMGLADNALNVPALGRPSVVPGSDPLRAWNLLPRNPNWATGFGAVWTPGEAAALGKVSRFTATSAQSYNETRNFPGICGTSQLSPHLHWGEISPRRVVREVRSHGLADDHTFLTEIGWREFGRHLLWHQPDFHRSNFQKKFDAFPWRSDPEGLERWQKGQTGYPIVDAGMAELWQTGWMHNRVRMIVASFLTKHLRIHWREGEAWFWDTLVDADLASNAMGWQWTAGTGADAAPYFRVFNPIAQGEKFDKQGVYTRKFLPQLANVPVKFLFAPWTAGPSLLPGDRLLLGSDYPWPVVDHDRARKSALAAFDTIK
jgi:deoxyribodipyrimidine photo-lyase